jgi:predicted nuclease of predicted toxin-antitoxin system
MPATTLDADIVAWARVHDRVVVTFDVDIPKLLATSLESRPRVIHLRLASARPSEVVSALERAVAAVREESPLGWIVVVDDLRVRVRAMPLDA